MAVSPPTERLFYAILPDAAARQRILSIGEELRKRHGLTGKAIAPERLHITIHHLGDYAADDERWDGVVDAAKRAAGSCPTASFEICLDRSGSFRSGNDKRPCVLLGPEGENPLRRLHLALGDRMAAQGLGSLAVRTFNPHVTLLYDRAMLPVEPIEPITWTATELVLIHSKLGRSEHHRLDAWPFVA